MNYYLGVLKKYVVFSGRASRKEFWMFTLIDILVLVLLSVIEQAAGLEVSGSGILTALYTLGTFLPRLAVMIRRLHDIGSSGWSYLMILIPFIGVVILILRAAQAGQPGENKYGPDPKGATTPATPPAAAPPASMPPATPPVA